MQGQPDIRWKQRYANLIQAHALLEEALQRGVTNLNQLEKEGLTQRFGKAVRAIDREYISLIREAVAFFATRTQE